MALVVSILFLRFFKIYLFIYFYLLFRIDEEVSAFVGKFVC